MTLPPTLLAIARDPDRLDGVRWARLRDLAAASLRTVARADPRATFESPAMVVLVTQPDDDRHWADASVVSLSLAPRTVNGAHLAPWEVAGRVSRAETTDLAPPFAAATASSPLALATDSAGLRHLYWSQQRGWAAVSSSSMVLARLTEKGIDAEALGAYALIGNYLRDRTPFAGVRVLPAGCVARLDRGNVIIQHPPAPTKPLQYLERRAAVGAGVEAVREVVDGCLRAYPDSLLELSGGLDSRMLLAAMSRDQRRSLRAVTIGPAASGDHRVAEMIADHEGLAHIRVASDALEDLAPEELLGLATSAAFTRDCSGNPTALAVLDWHEARLDQGPRLTGQNGEFARGFYYPGQRAHAAPQPELVDSLARWRIFANDAVDQDLFAEGFLNDVRAATLRDLRDEFGGYDSDWLSSTDEFYLRQRMRRWVGITYSSACMRRPVQAPFFHPAYVDWARSCAPADKRGSRLFAEVLAALDPDLARLPLDDSRTPIGIFAPSPRQRVQATWQRGRKVLRKVDQRLRRRGRPATGARIIASGVQAAWAAQDGALGMVADMPFLDDGVLEEVGRGERSLNPSSVGLLLDLLVATTVTGDPAPEPRQG